MIEIDEAKRRVLECIEPLPSESVELRAALGRVLAEDITADGNVPAHDGSAMDGFAVRAEDTRGAGGGAPVTLRVVDESRAGRPASSALKAGEAIAISTGAVIPKGADAVVRVERTRPTSGERAGGGNGEESENENENGHENGDRLIEIRAEVEAGHDVRYAGEDIERGETVLERGARIGPAELGVLASAGHSTVACARRARVAVVCTGDELIEPGERMREGAVRNSNAYAIPGMAQQAGAEVVGPTMVADDPERTKEAIANALDADVVVVCGGISVGPHDHVKQALGDLGVKEVFWRIALKPGKPVWFGRYRRPDEAGGGQGAADARETLVFGLPGNPVSAMVTFTLLVRPALNALSGRAPEERHATAMLDRGCKRSPDRTQALRCTVQARDDGLHAEPFERQGSHIGTSMRGADALAMIPPGQGEMKAGDRIKIVPLRDG
jgi:molybdopterin molybdotransferase